MERSEAFAGVPRAVRELARWFSLGYSRQKAGQQRQSPRVWGTQLGERKRPDVAEKIDQRKESSRRQIRDPWGPAAQGL